MNSTEFQIKFKTAHKLNRLVSSISSNYTVIKLDCISTSDWDNSLMYLTGNVNGSNQKYFFKTQFDITKYFNQWLYLKVTNDNNNRTLTLSTDKNILVSLTSNVQGNITENQDVILGQSRGNSDFAGNQTLQIDLSETYFKNGDTIISEWNL